MRKIEYSRKKEGMEGGPTLSVSGWFSVVLKGCGKRSREAGFVGRWKFQCQKGKSHRLQIELWGHFDTLGPRFFFFSSSKCGKADKIYKTKKHVDDESNVKNERTQSLYLLYLHTLLSPLSRPFQRFHLISHSFLATEPLKYSVSWDPKTPTATIQSRLNKYHLLTEVVRQNSEWRIVKIILLYSGLLCFNRKTH